MCWCMSIKMLKIFFFLSAFVFCYIQCVPIKANSQASASQQTLHLHVKNSTEATNYHLTPIIDELEDIDEEVNEELEAILPYINFLFDLFSHGSKVQEDECLDSMVIQLVPDKFTNEGTVIAGTTQQDEPAEESASEPTQ